MGFWRRLLLKKLGATQYIPFTFEGYPDNPVFIHSNCGTILDVSLVSKDVLSDIEQGNCDCETVAPWLKVYVRRDDASR